MTRRTKSPRRRGGKRDQSHPQKLQTNDSGWTIGRKKVTSSLALSECCVATIMIYNAKFVLINPPPREMDCQELCDKCSFTSLLRNRNNNNNNDDNNNNNNNNNSSNSNNSSSNNNKNKNNNMCVCMLRTYVCLSVCMSVCMYACM